MYIADVKRNQGSRQGNHSKKNRITRKQLYTLLFWDPAKLSKENKDILSKLMKNPNLRETYATTQDFKKAIKTKNIKLFEDWVNDSLKSSIQEFKNFAKRISEDMEPVKNALLYDWNNGPLEGNINRIKMIKRTMYGRAGFDLLRKKILFSLK